MSDFWDRKPDLSRLPEHIKQGVRKALPLREYEVRGKILIFPVATQGLNHPNGRILSSPYKPRSADESYTEGLQIELLDFGALGPLATFIISLESAPTMFTGLFRSFKRCGGDLAALKQIIEEIEK